MYTTVCRLTEGGLSELCVDVDLLNLDVVLESIIVVIQDIRY